MIIHDLIKMIKDFINKPVRLPLAPPLGNKSIKDIQKDLPDSVSVISPLVIALIKDDEYYNSWKSTLAMSFFDSFQKWNLNQMLTTGMNDSDLIEISNNAADNFLTKLTK